MMNWELQSLTPVFTLRAEAEMESTVKQMRMIWIFFLVAAFAYVGVAEFLPHSLPPIKPEIYWIILGMAIMELAAIVILRNTYFGKAEEVLRTNPNDAAATFRWRQGQLATMAVASAIILFGLVIRFIGATTIQAVPLYALGFAAMVIFQPQAVQ